MDALKPIKPNSILQQLLLRGHKRSRLWLAGFTLCIGATLLLLSVMIWSDFQNLLSGSQQKDSLGSTFLTLSKTVDDAAMAHHENTQFQQEDIVALKNAPEVQDVGLLTPANFKVSASLGSGAMSFYTLLFLEAAPDRFMDKRPSTWQWHEGDFTLPIILSRDFLNMYNYIFAPSQGLPLLSEQSVKALGFTLSMGEGANTENYRAQVEGFSDRISSVLVPQTFIDYGNQRFGKGKPMQISRAIVKVGDPSKQSFVQFLEQHEYTTNSEQLRFSKMRSIVEITATGTGLIALIMMFVGSLVFVLFIELTMAKARASVQLLLQLGYSPKMLQRFLLKKYLPILALALTMALLLAISLQFIIAQKLKGLQLELPIIPGVYVWLSLGLSSLVLWLQIRQSIRKSIRS